MPIVRIDLSGTRSPEQRAEISAGIHRAFTRSVGIPEGDKFHIVTAHPATELIADPTYLGMDRRDIVFIQITFVRGRSTALKQGLYRAIVSELSSVGVRPDDVAIVLAENGPEDYSWGNGEAQLLSMGAVPGTTPGGND